MHKILATVIVVILLSLGSCRDSPEELAEKIEHIMANATSKDKILQSAWASWKPSETYDSYRDYPERVLGLKKWEEVKLETHDGLVLDGWFIPLQTNEPAEPKGTLLIMHGSETDMREALKSCMFLVEHGYQLLPFNSRQNNPERPISFLREELEDIGQAIAYLQQRDDVPAERIGIFGFSLGAIKAVLAGAMYETLKVVIEDAGPVSYHDFAEYVLTERDRDKEVRKIRQESPDYLNAYLKLISDRALVKTLVQRHKVAMEEILGYSLDEYDAVKQVKKISPRAILVIHGQLDERVRLRSSERIYEAAGQPKEFLIAPNSGHLEGMFKARDLYVPKVLSFLQKHLH